MELPQLNIPEGQQSLSHCFGCGEANPIGLHLTPRYDGEEVTATFMPEEEHQGWHKVMHGGIVYSILDETTAYTVLCSGYSFGVTAKSTIRFRQMVPTEDRLKARAPALKVTPRLIQTHGQLELDDGSVVAEVESLFVPGERCRRAFLWDMDGVIVDSAAPHYQSWREAFAARGADFTEEKFRFFFGTRDDYIIERVLGHRPDSEVTAITEEKGRRYRELIRDGVRPFPGVLPLLKAMKKNGFRMALGTSAPMANFEAVASQLGLTDCFDAVVCGADVQQSKPNPEIYLRAAEKLGAAPEDCVVFEDSPHGVEAGKRGGMKCVAITNSHEPKALIAADRVVDSLEELDLVQLIRWI